MLGSTNFQKPQLLSQLVHPFLLLNFYLPRYSYLSLVFRAVIFMFHPFSGISHSRKFKLVPRNFPLENGRKSPGNEIGGVWEIRELKHRRRRRQREQQKRNRFRWCTYITLFVHLFAFTPRHDVKMPNFTKLFFFSWTTIQCLRIELQKNLPTFDVLKEIKEARKSSMQRVFTQFKWRFCSRRCQSPSWLLNSFVLSFPQCC